MIRFMCGVGHKGKETTYDKAAKKTVQLRQTLRARFQTTSLLSLRALQKTRTYTLYFGHAFLAQHRFFVNEKTGPFQDGAPARRDS